jgi:predicted hotdog family 3-hydroxylacyl-ACP dehydratase
MDKSDIDLLLPHAGDMALLETVTLFAFDRIECTATSHIAPQNPLRAGEVLPASAAIEYAAQAIALHGVLRNRERGVDKSALMAVLRRVRWAEAPLSAAASPLTVSARQIAELGDSAQYAFEVVDARGLEFASGEATFMFVASKTGEHA